MARRADLPQRIETIDVYFSIQIESSYIYF